MRASSILGATLEWCVLRHLLYLDKEPAAPDLRFPAKPLGAVYWICTQACNLRCTYCYQEAMLARPQELTTEEALNLVEQVVEAEARTFIFTGGEPFSRRDLLTVARHSKERGLRTNVITNGHYVTPKNVDSVAEIFDLVTISLDHGKPHHHDRNRGEGSWRRAVSAIELLLKAGVSVDVNSVLSRFGLGDLEELFRFVGSKKIGQHRVVPQFPMGRGATARGEELTSQEIVELPDRLHIAHTKASAQGNNSVHAEGDYSSKGRLRSHCGAGLTEVSVDPEGWVYPCKLLQYPEFRTQNIRQARLREIYASHPKLSGIRDKVAKSLHPCKTCIIRDSCGGGCRGIHFSFTRDYNNAHPLFCALLRRQFEVAAWRASGDGSVPPPGLAGSDPGIPENAFVPLAAVTASHEG
ncbi:radical SAM protein [Streptomyces durhamensis]|uniref:radical SAM protein n=1 Tax=Streptomyces durhamensis TaxID=68194 RepID=UPI003CC91B53